MNIHSIYIQGNLPGTTLMFGKKLQNTLLFKALDVKTFSPSHLNKQRQDNYGGKLFDKQSSTIMDPSWTCSSSTSTGSTVLKRDG